MTEDACFHIHSYDLFLFDLDGTLTNVEFLQYKAFLGAFEFFNVSLATMTFDDYCRFVHLDDATLGNYVSNFSNIPFDNIHRMAKEIFLDILNRELDYIKDADNFLYYLTKHHEKAKMCAVSNCDSQVLKIICKKLPLLQRIDHVITINDCMNKQPHPECYIKAWKTFEDQTQKPIGFESSYKGYLALKNANILPVFIGSTCYPHFYKLKASYYFRDFSTIDWEQLESNDCGYSDFVDVSLDRYIKSFTVSKHILIEIMKQIIPLLKYRKGNIYLTGIGKCSYICMKSISTWQGMGITCHFLNIPNLFHGEFGLLKHNDIIIYISKSGNTEEMLKCCEYIRTHFHILQIGLTMQKDCRLKEYVNFHSAILKNISDISEIDAIDMTPTTSSVLFLTLLDMIGVRLAEENDFAAEKFKFYHPAGDLGRIQIDIIDYVVIIAIESDSYMNPLTKYLSKILVTFYDKPFVQHMVEYWQKYSKKIIIVSHSHYNELLHFYCINYSNIHLINFDRIGSGTIDIIHHSITSEYYGRNIIFSRCDILPDEDINIAALTNSTIFTYKTSCSSLSREDNDNMLGIFYIKEFQGLQCSLIYEDLGHFLLKTKMSFERYQLNYVIDISSIEKFRKYTTHALMPTLIKRSMNLQQNSICETETDRYTNLETKEPASLLNDIDSSTSKINVFAAKPIHEIFDNFSDEQKLNTISKIIIKLDKLHEETISITKDTLQTDLFLECDTKLNSCFKKIKIICDFFGYIHHVNNLEIYDFSVMVRKCRKIIEKYTINRSNYTFLHGNCRFSNALVDEKTNEILFIGSYSCFGKTRSYGLPEYDYAKLLYALSGYDKFNIDDEQHIQSCENGSIYFDLSNHLHLVDRLPYKIVNPCTFAFLIINWITAAETHFNNILKCCISYYYAHYLYSRYISKTEDHWG